MRLSSKIIALQSVPKGCGVSYGQTWRSARDSRIAVVNMGYGDGYPRVVPSGTPVWVGGQRCPIVGRVCMEMMMVDVTDLPQVAIGDEVVLWGPELPVEIIAEAAGTIGYELLTRVRGRRISFEIV